MKTLFRVFKTDIFWLLLVTLLAAFLRLYKLGAWSFWKDEIFTLGNKQDGMHLALLGESFVRYMIQWTVAALGTNEWTARLVPAAIGIATVPLFYFPVRTLFGKGTGLMAASLLAVSSWHIYWSQTARFYILLMAFCAFSLLALMISVEHGRPRMAIWSLFFLFLAARESLVALLLVPIMAGYFIILGLFFPLGALSFRNRNTLVLLFVLVLVGTYFAAPYLRDLPAFISAFGRINNSPFWILAASSYYIGLPVMGVGVFTALQLLMRRERLIYLLVLWALLPLVIVMLLSLFQYTATRYILISLPAWIILAAIGASHLWDEFPRAQRLLAAGFIAILLIVPLGEDALYYTYQNGNRENGRAAYAYVRENMQSGDLVVTSDPEVGDYYMGYRTLPMSEMGPGIFKRYQQVWFVENIDGLELYPAQMEWIRENARLVANYDVNASARIFIMKVYLYEVPHGQG